MNKRYIPARKQILSGFFLFMLACTAISRIYDSMTVPKVLTSTAKQKTVESIFKGRGTVKVKETTIYPVFAGLRIEKTFIAPGNEVQEGQVLFQYDIESIMDRKEELLLEREQIDLNIKKEQINEEVYPELTQTELAQWELELAQKELEEEQVRQEEEKQEYEKKLQRLEEEYQEDMAMINDELWQKQDREWETAKRTLETAKSSRDRELRAAQRIIDDLIEDLDQTSDEEQEKAVNIERELSRAREDYDALEASWKEQINSAQTQLELLEDQEEQIYAGRTSTQENRKKAYQEELWQQEEQMKAVQSEQKDKEKSVEKAQWQLSVAQKQDMYTQLSNDQKRRIAALTIRGMELEKKMKSRQLSGLEELLSKGGEITALENGIVMDMELTAGKTTSGEEIVSLAVGENQFEGTFLKENQKLAKGDQIKIDIPGTAQKKEAAIEQINLFGDTEGIFKANLGDLELPLGSITTYTCTKQSDIFPKVIPLEGLRKDIKGYYCLVARARTAILGEEFRAERINVELLYQGSQEAAIEGSIFAEDAVIIGENKSISEGSRVRPVNQF